MAIENHARWIVSARTAMSYQYPIMGIKFSPVRKQSVVLYVQLPVEVENLPIPIRTHTLDRLGFDEPDEKLEDCYPLIIINETYAASSMRNMNLYSFFRNLKLQAARHKIDLLNPHSARHLIGKKIETRFVQMRKENTDSRLWAPDRVGLKLI